MPMQKTITLYTFDELSDRTKQKARDWYRSGIEYDWYDFIYEDAARIGLKITSFDLGRSKKITGYLTESVQTICKTILAEHGPSCDTHTLALEWITPEPTDEDEDEDDHADDFKYALLEEYFVLLNQEWEYINSDEQVDESIIANEYTFTEHGKRED